MPAYTPEEIYAVRILIPDAEGAYGPNNDEFLFSDEDISAILATAKGSTMWAAGLAMIAVGNSEALIGKTIRNYETETDASKLQREWRSAGQVLIQAGREEVALSEEDVFEVAFPNGGTGRHPEGRTHGSYRGLPGSYQW